MKYWLSHLPLEVWVDVFCYPWIGRRELARIVYRFRNRKYTEYLQFYLHDWGKHRLNNLTFAKVGLCTYVDYAPYHLYPRFPRTPMPANIKCFECITISHFGAQTLNFLRQIEPILTDVNLALSGISPQNLDQFRAIFANLQPLLSGIHSFSFDVCALTTMAQLFRAEFSKLKVLELFHFEDEPMDGATLQTTVSFITDWLNSPMTEEIGNEPKLCEALIHNDYAFGPQILLAIREQFLMATHTSTFALFLRLHLVRQPDFVEFHLQNSIGEELHGVQLGHGHFRITRHRPSWGTELQERIEENKAKSRRQNRIQIINPTIG